MTYQVLARKWRPKNFSEVIGQDHVVRALSSAVINKRVAHAYLLTGTRGVGKTTIARVFAKAIRCENPINGNPCHQCENCLSFNENTSMDYIEIDGASNNGVENIRTLVDNVQYLPARGAKKVYVIDEVHMLSNNAFNALLKTLEEPPEHMVIIFATTEPDRLLGTVLSRCQRYDFRSVPMEQLKNHLSMIASKEEITFETDFVLEEICRKGKGSVRDSLSLLDQVVSYSETRNLTEDTLYQALGIASTSALKNILAAILQGESVECTKVYRELIIENIHLQKFVIQLLESFYFIIQNIDHANRFTKHLGITSEDLEKNSTDELFWIYEVLSRDLQWALSSMLPVETIEIVLQKICLRRQFFSPASEQIKTQSKPETVQQEKKTSAKTWTNFVEDLYSDLPTTAANLEHGAVISENITEDSVSIEILYKNNSKIFYDYFLDLDAFNKLKEKASQYFHLQKEQIRIKIDLYKDHHEQQAKDIETVVEKKERVEQEDLANKEKEIREDFYITQAQQLFNTQVDKVILKKDEI